MKLSCRSRGKVMRGTLKAAIAVLSIAGAAIALASSADAAWYGPGPGWGGPRAYGPAWRGPRGYVGPAWTGGHWNHGWHGARYGWWWTVGNAWYYYPQPVYPYPGYLPGDEYYDGSYNLKNYPQQYIQPTPSAQPRSSFWYYCDSPRGYYPYVRDCDNWREVLADPNSDPPRDGPPPPDYDP